jgi:plasmid maintenance system antidote protein VapI
VINSDMPKTKRFSDQVRQAIADAPITRYRLAQLTGVGEPTLSKFVSCKAGISWDSIDAVAKVLGLHVQSGEVKHGVHR